MARIKCKCRPMATTHHHRVSAPPLRRGWRLFLFYFSAVLLTGCVASFRRSALAHGLECVPHPAAGAVYHFVSADRRGLHARRVWLFPPHLRHQPPHHRTEKLPGQNIDGVSTAIIFPIYNEDSVGVLGGLRAHPLRIPGAMHPAAQAAHFDHFISAISTQRSGLVESLRIKKSKCAN